MASSSERAENPRTDAREATPPGAKPVAAIPAAEAARRRVVRRGGNIHIQDEDQSPTGMNKGNERAAVEAAATGADTAQGG